MPLLGEVVEAYNRPPERSQFHVFASQPLRKTMKGERVNTPYNRSSQGNPSRVIFTHGAKISRGECYTRVAWMFSRKTKMPVTPLEVFSCHRIGYHWSQE